MTHLAQRRDEAVSSRDVAERYNIPKRLLAEVMKDLLHRGLLRSVRGATGGYRLASDPAEMSVLSILQALEGPFEMVPCTSMIAAHPLTSCELLMSCPIKGPIHKIHERINQMLETVTIDDLSRGDAFAFPAVFGLGSNVALQNNTVKTPAPPPSPSILV